MDVPTVSSVPRPQPTPEWTPYEDEPFTIVFMRDGELWMSEVGGRGEWALTNEGLRTDEKPYPGVHSFAVSPDGQFIAYIVHDEHNDLVKVMNVMEGSTQVVGSTSEPYRVFAMGFQSPAWWDNVHVAYYYTSEPPQTKEDNTIQQRNLVVIDLETGESTVEPFSAFRYPSPDGRYVLSVPLYVLHDRETGEEWTVVEEDRGARFLGWSPDSQLMLFSLRHEHEDPDGLLIVDAETRAERVVTPEDKVAYAYSHSVAWSPDGQVIAYLQCDPPTTSCGNPELWLVNSDGANRRRISMDVSGICAKVPTYCLQNIMRGYMHCTNISWTSDVSRLVFETILEPNIWSVRLDGTDLRPISDGQNLQVLPEP